MGSLDFFFILGLRFWNLFDPEIKLAWHIYAFTPGMCIAWWIKLTYRLFILWFNYFGVHRIKILYPVWRGNQKNVIKNRMFSHYFFFQFRVWCWSEGFFPSVFYFSTFFFLKDSFQCHWAALHWSICNDTFSFVIFLRFHMRKGSMQEGSWRKKNSIGKIRYWRENSVWILWELNTVNKKSYGMHSWLPENRTNIMQFKGISIVFASILTLACKISLKN